MTRIGRSLATTVAWMILADAWVRGPAARAAEFRIGITGLDTSHATAFTKAFNFAEPALEGMRVVAAQGIEIVESIAAVLERSDGVLLETNDGRLGTFRGMRPLSAGRR